ncbi:hypothetical protein HDU96_004611, partial [Phlyctochytrium bullatum]
MATKRHLIPSESITIKASERIGTGAFGSVYKAKFANEVVAVKRLNRSALEAAAATAVGKDALEQSFEEEARILSDLNHPRI